MKFVNIKVCWKIINILHLKTFIHEILLCVVVDGGIERATYPSLQRKGHCLDMGAQKLVDAHPVNHFRGFWGKNIKIAHPVSLIYLPVHVYIKW